jgi:N-acetylmuramoyl-L-alanine amidase
MAKTYIVKRGETILQVARANGFRSWQPIWEHAQNAALRKKRPNPHVLAKGDELFIPDKTPKDFGCATNQKHTFRVVVPEMSQRLHQAVLDENGEPLAGKNYELKVEGKTIKGKTGPDGVVKAELSLDAAGAELKVWQTEGDDDSAIIWTLQLGHLEPVDTTFGLKGHLNSLGYDCGEVNDQLDEKTKEALSAFQSDQGLPQSGQGDAATLDKLRGIFKYPVQNQT